MVYKIPKCRRAGCDGCLYPTGKSVGFDSGSGETMKCNKCGQEEDMQTHNYC